MNARFKPIVCDLLTLILFTSVTRAAENSLSVGNAPGYPGATVSVPVSLRQPDGGAVAAQFDMTFNPGKVSALAALRGERLTNHVVRSRHVASGVERVLIYSRANAAMPGTNVTVATAPFQVAPNEYVGSGPITPTNVVLARAEATRLVPVSLNAGTIFVRPVNPLPNRTVQFFLPSEADTRYQIQATTDFEAWVNLTNTVATGDFMDLFDADAPNYSRRFYRWVAHEALGQLTGAQVASDGRVRFNITGLAGRDYTVQASTNLLDWADLASLRAVADGVSFTNEIAPNFPSRFFRLKSR